MTRDRTDGGHYTQEYTEAEVLELFSEAALPVLSSPEVADQLGCTNDTARTRLESLVEDGVLHRKEVGARAVVYVQLDAGDGRRSGYGDWKRSLWE